jgi:hypothetical protein
MYSRFIGRRRWMVLEDDGRYEVGKNTHREAIMKVADEEGILQDKVVFLKKKSKSSRVILCFNMREDGFMQVRADMGGQACTHEGQEIEREGRRRRG